MKILNYPNQPHCFAFGGFDMQMLNLISGLNKIGVDSKKMDVWSRDSDFDILHLWNVTQSNFSLISWAKKSNKKIVATILFPYSNYLLWLKYYKNIFTNQMKIAKYHHQIVDHFVVLNESQRDVLSKYYAIDKSRISIIPNIVNENYFNFSINKITNKYFNGSKYFLCTGNICSRKNQINLAKAAIKTNINLLIIGSILDGEDDYAKELAIIQKNNRNVIWETEINEGSFDLVSAYYYCEVFALVSNEETQPISALEAVALNKPILLLNKEYAKQKYYNNAFLADGSDVSSIVKAINNVLLSNFKFFTNPYINECKEESVALSYKDVYIRTLNACK